MVKIGKAVKYKVMKKGKSNKDLFEAVAEKEGISTDEARKEMELAIHEARNNPDPEKRAEFKKRFGDRIPTPEEFIYVVTREIKEQEGNNGDLSGREEKG